jgi:hypothetical protein
VSKVRKRSGEELDGSDIFSDQDFDADRFVDDMDADGGQQKVDTRASWRRLEELKDERMLRDQLLDWDSFDENDAV